MNNTFTYLLRKFNNNSYLVRRVNLPIISECYVYCHCSLELSMHITSVCHTYAHWRVIHLDGWELLSHGRPWNSSAVSTTSIDGCGPMTDSRRCRYEKPISGPRLSTLGVNASHNSSSTHENERYHISQCSISVQGNLD